MFTEDQVQNLIDRSKIKLANFELKGDRKEDLPIVYDKKLLDMVIEKFEYIKSLKACKKDVRETKHNVEDLTKYLEAC